MSRVLCMMSGGVDSNVVAYLLKQAGHDVVGVTLSLWWDNDANTCCGVAANCRASEVCRLLGIEHYALNKRMDFMKYVVNPYVNSHKEGLTPSPCLNCNTNIKIGGMLKYADMLDCQYVATGHYVRNVNNTLKLAADASKDQTYMLSRVKSDVLPRLMFPLGDMLKADVREIAEANNIYSPSDSQDLCFVEKKDRSEFLQQHGVEFKPGNIVNDSGEILGGHDGIYNYTIGQRKGLPPSSTGPLYVIRMNRNDNSVVVGSEGSLMKTTCLVKDFNWQYTPLSSRVTVKVRYRAPAVNATLERDGELIKLVFDEPQKAITPGQAAVLYDNDTVIGGGWITEQ